MGNHPAATNRPRGGGAQTAASIVARLDVPPGAQNPKMEASMTAEVLWYDYCSHTGRPPEPQPLPEDELADPTLPLRLALAYVEGEAGYRVTKYLPHISIWYWSRRDSTSRWWLIPAIVEQEALAALNQARIEARKRAGGPVGAWEVAHVLRVRLGRVTE